MISAPEEDILTLERVKNQITMGESEVRRLRDLKDYNQAAVDQLVKDAKWYAEEIERLRTVKSEVVEELRTLSPQLKEARSTVENAVVIKNEIDKKQDDSLHALQLQRQVIEANNAALEDKQREHSLAERDLIARSETVRSKESLTDARLKKLENILIQIKGV
jgi:hypothetical protein